MEEFDNTNRGAMFKNDKEGNEKRPDYTGSLNVEGTEYKLSAWIREAKSGSKFMSIACDKKEAKPAAKPAPRRNSDVSGFDPDTDEIPF